MSKKIFIFFIILVFWVILQGEITFDVLLVGVFASLLTTVLFNDVIFSFPDKKFKITDYLRKIILILLFIPVFFYEAFISAIKVSRHVFERKPSFSPGIVRVKTSLNSYTAITILANLITLTPGTLTLDFDREEKAYYIHWIDVKTQKEAEARREIIERFEEWLEVIFE